MVACRHSENLEFVKYMINELEADPQFVCDNGTPFIAAIDGNKKGVIQYFIDDLGYDINKTDALGNSPLYIATFKGNLEIVKYLLSKGADPWIKGPKNSTVLHVCAERNFLDIAKAIISQDPQKNEPLVFEQTEIDEEGEGNMTAMHVACEWNSTEIVEYYFEIGGEKLVRMKNSEGMDAIEFAYAENMEIPYGYLNR